LYFVHIDRLVIVSLLYGGSGDCSATGIRPVAKSCASLTAGVRSRRVGPVSAIVEKQGHDGAQPSLLSDLIKDSAMRVAPTWEEKLERLLFWFIGVTVMATILASTILAYSQT
jgi:hypothetical protein